MDEKQQRARIFFDPRRGLMLAALGLALAAANAQTMPPQVQSLDRFQAEQERLKKMLAARPTAYEDKVMDASSLPPLADADAPVDPALAGFRAYVSETRLDYSRSHNGAGLRSSTELGQRVALQRETLNYGDFTAQVDVRSAHGDPGLGYGPGGFSSARTGTRLTLRNLGLPVTPDLFADTSLGDMSSELTDALSRSYRLSLGSGQVRGVGTHLFDARSDLRAGFGERSRLSGGPYPGYEGQQGRLAWAGYSRRFSDAPLPGAYAGVQAMQASGMPSYPVYALFPVNTPPGQTENVSSLASAVGIGSEAGQTPYRARLIHVRSQASASGGALPGQAQGFFLEGGLRSGAFRHELGAYQANPNLRFGDYALPSDNRGAYWRVDTSGLRANWGLGLDLEQQNPDGDPGRLSADRTGLSANAQWRLNRNDAVGGNLNLGLTRYHQRPGAWGANAGDGTRSVYASAYYETRVRGWGRSRLRATVHRNEVLVFNDLPATGEEIEWEQDWITGRYETGRPEFTTTLGLARDRSNGMTQTSPTAGVVFRAWPASDWSLGGSFRYTSRSGNLATSRGLSGTLDTEIPLGGGWRLGASLSLNQSVVNVAASAWPGLAPSGTLVSRSNDKFAAIHLRWEGSSGVSYQSLGLRGAGQAGGGSLDGVVYYDANRDGEQQAGEGGVAHVEVVLDQRYRTTTDRSGRFDFPLVTSGTHQLTLQLDSVPLPWGAEQDHAIRVNVPLRGQATARIPVVKVGE